MSASAECPLQCSVLWTLFVQCLHVFLRMFLMLLQRLYISYIFGLFKYSWVLL